MDNILAKDRSARIAESIVGVRGVVNRIDVNPGMMRKNSELKQAVVNALFDNPATDSYEVDVTARDGNVTLTGTVPHCLSGV